MATSILNGDNYNLLGNLSNSDLENIPSPNSTVVTRLTTDLQHLQVLSEKGCDEHEECSTDDNSTTINMSKYPINNKIKSITKGIHVLIVLFVLFIFYLSFRGNVELFTWHPPFMIAGWFLFITQGILSLLAENPITRNITHRNKVRLHWILQSTASLCIYVGFSIVLVNKNINNKHHFATWHAKFGLFTILCIFCTSLGGILALYNLRFKHLIKPLVNKTVHTIFGVNAFVFGNLTIILGFYSHWFIDRTHFYVQILCIIVTFFIMAWTTLKPIKFILYRLRIIFK